MCVCAVFSTLFKVTLKKFTLVSEQIHTTLCVNHTHTCSFLIITLRYLSIIDDHCIQVCVKERVFGSIQRNVHLAYRQMQNTCWIMFQQNRIIAHLLQQDNTLPEAEQLVGR